MSLKAQLEAIIYAAETPITLEQITALVKESIAAEGVTDEGEIDAVFESLARERPDVLLVNPDPFMNSRREQIVALANHYKLPAFYQWAPRKIAATPSTP